MKRILVPSDFSVQADHALNFAEQLVDEDDGHIMLLHCISPAYPMDTPYLDPVTAASYAKNLKKEALKKLNGIGEKYRNTNVQLDIMAESTPLIDTVNELAIDSDAIVMGTKGASGLKELLVGSNTEKVIRNAPCPVFTLHSRCNLSKINRVLVPITASEISYDFVLALKKLQRKLDAVLYFVWIHTPHVIENEEVVNYELDTFLSHHFESDFHFSVCHDILPETGILRFASEIDADLIAIPTHQRRGIAHLFYGSVAEEVANHAEIPVWGFPIRKEHQYVDLSEYQWTNKQAEYGDFLL
ncbi:MAG: universal stress protein [Cyclobacteriaceae bacterium]|nr:universal stress protein [Cyclobacteriaceae bacterium HetDA_MAG_MS6]